MILPDTRYVFSSVDAGSHPRRETVSIAVTAPETSHVSDGSRTIANQNSSISSTNETKSAGSTGFRT